MLTYSEIDPIIFSVGPLAIRWYGLMYVIGFIAAWILASRRARERRSPVKPNQVDDLIFLAMIGVIVGGR
ncbi:MAG: prolipoprotein diacylglyceryl transferase family protein, partial [Pseudomonadota bacterium]|nr:prolipoprotein diacylglyceryl transferase family protein [Pseudomonadota bacterium]